MAKHFLIALVILSLVALSGCVGETAVLGEIKTFEITSDIHSFDIQINAADFTIVQGDEFSVESNLKNLSVSEEDGVLRVVDKTKHNVSYNNATLKLYIPKGITFEDALIKTGAGKLTAESLSANTMELKTGAGKVEFGSLEAYTDIDVKGGAGEISILGGTLNNLSLNLGMGELDMTVQLLGESDLKFGVGESDLTLIGSKDDYKFDIENGIGKITVDNKAVSAFDSDGSGQNLVKIKGGVGATNIEFQK